MSERRQRVARQSMERLLRLQEVTSELSQALTPEQVARVIVRQAGPAMGACDACIYLLSEPGVLRFVQAMGLPEAAFERWQRLSVDAPVPIAEAAREETPVWVESLKSFRQRYPALDDIPLSQDGAWAFLPLHVDRRLLGVLAVGFPLERGFAAEDKDFACLIARQCSQALERALLYARERELREAAERARAEVEEQRRLLESEHRRLQAVLQQLPQGVILAEAPSGRMVMANDQVLRLGRGPVPRDWRLEEYSATRGFHPDGRPYLPNEWPLVRALGGEAVRGEVAEFPGNGGPPLMLEMSAGPVRDAEGRVTAAVAVLEDITERLRMERALREGECVFRRIMESNMMGLSFCDKDGLLLEANDAFLSLVGHEREELRRGHLHWRNLLPRGEESIEHGLREPWTHGTSPTIELELRRGDGSLVPVLTGSAWVEEQERVLTFVLDLSDLKRAEGALRFLATASRILGQSLEVPDATLQHVACLASLSVASWCVIDLATPEGLLRRAAVAHREGEREERLRRGWPLPPLKESGGALLDAMHAGEPLLFPDFGVETWRYLASGAVPEVEGMAREACSVLVVPVRSHERTLGLVTLGSCSPRRRYGPEDISLGQELAHRVAAALESARLFMESQRAVRLRDEFLAVASHELKTPLTPLRLQLQGLWRVVESRAGRPVDPERVLRAARICEAQVRKLSGLVNDLLDVSRLAQGRLPLRLEQVNLVAIAREVIAQFSDDAARAGCAVELWAGPAVVGHWDRVRLEQVVTNLLTNALKYGAGRPVHVRVWMEGGVARLSVRDEGIGIAPEHRSRIFGKFERAVSERHYGGLGLGLHITQQIVQALGGSILVESEPGRGSTFTVELPPGVHDMLAHP
ncbi:GAF domain-containing protein [Archangium violaceum]|uniref:sensor histidine kinase n=1 Tax=Archangium violaceum TaxID=83451 RepID=UPI00193BAC3E|nr:ATP-binding protein [Archangium violaceum]QRK11441.1 GAF domain-containing protein [Archangium violaceum]